MPGGFSFPSGSNGWSPANRGSGAVVVRRLTGRESFIIRPNGPPSATGLWNDNGVLALTSNYFPYPMSPIGLPPGSLWNDGLTVACVPVTTPDPAAIPVFFGGIGAIQLLRLGGANLPLSPTGLPIGQLWNNGGLVCVALEPSPPDPGAGLADAGGVLQITDASNWPTHSTGLPPGAVWDAGGAAFVVPGITPNPGAPPVLFGNITSAGLLAIGGGNLPTTDPGNAGQLWNSAGIICVSLG